MSIKTAYISKVGRSYKIAPHFNLGEMACKDGSDTVLYSTELMDKLEQLRAYGGFTISINSGYRNAAYNRKIGGASQSQHIKGTAADIVVRRNGVVVNARKICCLCQTLGFPGIGFISDNATHVDARASGSYRGDERNGYNGNVGGDFYKYFGIAKSTIEAMKVKEPVKEEPKEEEEMDQKQFNEMMDRYIAERAAAVADDWSAEDRKWAEGLGIVQGDGQNLGYKAFVTKEQTVAMLHRFAAEIVRNASKLK